MGRDAHLLRSILGRGATRQPDWEALTDQYERVGRDPVIYEGIDPSNPLTYGRRFDAKGRPYCPGLLGERQARAQALNHVTSILKHNAALESQPVPSAQTKSERREERELGLRDDAACLLGLVFTHGTEMVDHSFRSIRDRLLVFKGIEDGLDSAALLTGWSQFRFSTLLGCYPSKLAIYLMQVTGCLVTNPNLNRMSIARFPLILWRKEMYQDLKILR